MKTYTNNKYTYFVADKQKKVVAVSTYAGKIVRGVAKCDPRDEFSIDIGKKLAAARCNVKIAEKRAKRAVEKFAEAHRISREQMAYEANMAQYMLDSQEKLRAAQEELDSIVANI